MFIFDRHCVAVYTSVSEYLKLYVAIATLVSKPAAVSIWRNGFRSPGFTTPEVFDIHPLVRCRLGEPYRRLRVHRHGRAAFPSVKPTEEADTFRPVLYHVHRSFLEVYDSIGAVVSSVIGS
jgi:hypothetical protein